MSWTNQINLGNKCLFQVVRCNSKRNNIGTYNVLGFKLNTVRESIDSKQFVYLCYSPSRPKT